MKGKTKIQLFDTDGNLVYEQEKTNLITNAYINLLKPDFPIDIWQDDRYKYNGLVNYTPIHKELFGGVLLFSNELQESELNIMPTKEEYKNFIGNAGGVFAGKSAYRGSLNEAESKELKDENGNSLGYKWVWDFSTSAANGKINTICLTSAEGGNAGLIKDIDDNVPSTIFAGYGDRLSTNPTFKIDYRGSHLLKTTTVGDFGIYLFSKSNTKHVFLRYKLDKNNSKIGYIFTEINIAISEGINLTDFISNIQDELITRDTKCINFVEYELLTDKINDIREFVYDNGNIYYMEPLATSANLTLNLYSINKDTYNLQDTKTYILDNIDFSNGKTYTTFLNGFLYITNSNSNNLYIYNTSDDTFTNIVLDKTNYIPIKFLDTIMLIQMWDVLQYDNVVYILDADNRLCYNTLTLDADLKTNTDRRLFNNIFGDSNIFKYPILNFGTSRLENINTLTNKQYITQNIFTPYFGSINVVDSFTKYPTNTLKITYELTNY